MKEAPKKTARTFLRGKRIWEEPRWQPPDLTVEVPERCLNCGGQAHKKERVPDQSLPTEVVTCLNCGAVTYPPSMLAGRWVQTRGGSQP